MRCLSLSLTDADADADAVIHDFQTGARKTDASVGFPGFTTERGTRAALRYGTEIGVLDPPHLRAEIARLASALAATYA